MVSQTTQTTEAMAAWLQMRNLFAKMGTPQPALTPQQEASAQVAAAYIGEKAAAVVAPVVTPVAQVLDPVIASVAIMNEQRDIFNAMGTPQVELTPVEQKASDMVRTLVGQGPAVETPDVEPRPATTVANAGGISVQWSPEGGAKIIAPLDKAWLEEEAARLKAEGTNLLDKVASFTPIGRVVLPVAEAISKIPGLNASNIVGPAWNMGDTIIRSFTGSSQPLSAYVFGRGKEGTDTSWLYTLQQAEKKNVVDRWASDVLALGGVTAAALIVPQVVGVKAVMAAGAAGGAAWTSHVMRAAATQTAEATEEAAEWTKVYAEAERDWYEWTKAQAANAGQNINIYTTPLESTPSPEEETPILEPELPAPDRSNTSMAGGGAPFASQRIKEKKRKKKNSSSSQKKESKPEHRQGRATPSEEQKVETSRRTAARPSVSQSMGGGKGE
jgi:hypothetical protein